LSGARQTPFLRDRLVLGRRDDDGIAPNLLAIETVHRPACRISRLHLNIPEPEVLAVMAKADLSGYDKTEGLKQDQQVMVRALD
jgi:hypothetical protein